jgi:GDP-L-fucose synthase
MRVLLTGGSGMLGSALRRANAGGEGRLDIVAPTRAELDLTDAPAVRAHMAGERYDLVIHAAAKVGGIGANIADPAGFLQQNIGLSLAVIGGAMETGIPRLLNIGSSCMYPKDYRQPLLEADILQGALEPTNEGYALAKIVAARYCEYLSAGGALAYRTLIPSNLYGPGDTYSPDRSHLVASIIAKLHSARRARSPAVEIWGDGTARREFLYVDDLARWIVGLTAARIDALPPYLNLGYGADLEVADYYRTAARVMGYEGDFAFDLGKPMGMRQKLMDSSLAGGFGWAPATPIEEGIARAYQSYLARAGSIDD